jgi:hypothetical protein
MGAVVKIVSGSITVPRCYCARLRIMRTPKNASQAVPGAGKGPMRPVARSKEELNEGRRNAGAAVPVLYVGGCQRSGSTLLSRMIGQIPGYVSAGEVVHLWARGVKEDEMCGCGRRFHACPFWSEVGRRAFDGWDRLDVDEILSLKRRVDRNRYIPFMLVPSLSARYRRDVRKYTNLLNALYGAIHQTADGGVVVDSSKHASTAFLLKKVPSLDVRVVHLVRDSRGVAHSRARRLRRPEVFDREATMQRASPWKAGVEWLTFNLLFHILKLARTQTLLVRYENLVSAPRETLDRIVVGEHSSLEDSLNFVTGTHVTLDRDHTVSGNPMRFRHGGLDLRADDAWRRSMTPGRRWLTTLLTWPLLVAYRYSPNWRR